jgi:hypothetical protein
MAGAIEGQIENVVAASGSWRFVVLIVITVGFRRRL